MHGDSNGSSHEEKQTSILHDFAHLGFKNAETMAQALTTLASGQPIDDKQFLLEHGVSMLQSFPPNSGLSQKISDGFISMLWSDLPHPAPTMAGPTSRYRRHDGGGNCPWSPEMGKAGSPYARNVPPVRPKGPTLPDVESVYEALMKRKGPFRKHPSGLNRLFFSFATVVIHECFQTSRTNQFINETSSYVDLSTLYGNTEKEQKRVRTYQNGLIYPDSIASDRIMMMPPGVVAVLLLFSRNHNRIAADLLSINEEGKYKPWGSLDEKGQAWQDEDIFQLTRNINVGFFATVVLGDYVAAILNTPRANSQWSLNLGKEIKEGAKRVERGVGNLVSVEFAVLYHWHAALSAADDKWMEAIWKEEWPQIQSMDDITVQMFSKVMISATKKLMSTAPKDWTFGGLQRQADGSFKDTDLAGIIKSCIEEPAHEFGAHGTPASLKVVDLLGQLQAREVFNVCTLNEFRKYLNLKPYESFEEWNPDKEVARAARLLYGNVDNLELYPGLMAECTKPAMAGSGVCPGQTTGRGILDDAVALVRGDRFLSYDFNSNTLTNWGAGILQGHAPGSYCGVLPKILLNGLPGDFNGTSAYSLLPFYTPDAAKGILEGNKVIGQYDMKRPASGMNVVSVHTQEGCKRVLEGQNEFSVLSQSAIGNGANGPNVIHKVLFKDGLDKSVSSFFSATVKKLIAENSLSFTKGKIIIDIVRDVTNVVPILWLADRFAIPLKTNESSHGLMSVSEAFDAYVSVFLYENFNVIPADEWALRADAMEAAATLRPAFESHLKTQKGIAHAFTGWLMKDRHHDDDIYEALIETKHPSDELVADCIGIGAAVAGNLTQQASLLIDLFLSQGYEQYKARIVELAHMAPESSEQELQGFVFEGLRHIGSVPPGIVRVASKDVTITDGARGDVHVKAGQKIIAATSKAAMDPQAYHEPEKLDPHRAVKDNAILSYGMDSSLGPKLVGSSLAATLREVFKLKNVRRAQGKLGRFSTVNRSVAGVKITQYLDSRSMEQPVPVSLTLEYDA